MVPYGSDMAWTRSSNTGNFACAAGGTESRIVCQIIPPHGADLDILRVWGTDQSATADMQVTLTQACLPDTAGALPTLDVLATVTSSGSPIGFTGTDTLPQPTVADNSSCTYRVEVRLGNDNSTCATGLFFSKARLQWNRQIPPAPAVASFPDDMPPGVQFFAEVEALAATGITAGCGATTFCPDQPVTRRQMAAFLARALGLFGPTIADPANP
jgi:hypothetical protein